MHPYGEHVSTGRGFVIFVSGLIFNYLLILAALAGAF